MLLLALIAPCTKLCLVCQEPGAFHLPVLSCFVEEKLKACGCSKHSPVFCLVEVCGMGSGGIWIQDFTCAPLDGLTAKRCLYSGHGLHPFPVHRLLWCFRKDVLHRTANTSWAHRKEWIFTFILTLGRKIKRWEVTKCHTPVHRHFSSLGGREWVNHLLGNWLGSVCCFNNICRKVKLSMHPSWAKPIQHQPERYFYRELWCLEILSILIPTQCLQTFLVF